MKYIRIITLLLCLLAYLPTYAQDYLYLTLQRLTRTEENLSVELKISQRTLLTEPNSPVKYAVPVLSKRLEWIRAEKNRIILQIAGISDKKARRHIADIEQALEQIRQVAPSLDLVLATSAAPNLDVLNEDVIAEQPNPELRGLLLMCMSSLVELRSLMPDIDWRISFLQDYTPPIPGAAPAYTGTPLPPIRKPEENKPDSNGFVRNPAPTADATPTTIAPTEPAPKPAPRQEPKPPVTPPVAEKLAPPPAPVKNNSILGNVAEKRIPYIRTAFKAVNVNKPGATPPPTAAAASIPTLLGVLRFDTTGYYHRLGEKELPLAGKKYLKSWIDSSVVEPIAAMNAMGIKNPSCRIEMKVRSYTGETGFAYIAPTDIAARKQENLKLSRQRAAYVRGYLVEELTALRQKDGFKGLTFVVNYSGKGEEVPAGLSEADAAPRSPKRRVSQIFGYMECKAVLPQ